MIFETETGLWVEVSEAKKLLELPTNFDLTNRSLYFAPNCQMPRRLLKEQSGIKRKLDINDADTIVVGYPEFGTESLWLGTQGQFTTHGDPKFRMRLPDTRNVWYLLDGSTHPLEKPLYLLLNSYFQYDYSYQKQLLTHPIIRTLWYRLKYPDKLVLPDFVVRLRMPLTGPVTEEKLPDVMGIGENYPALWRMLPDMDIRNSSLPRLTTITSKLGYFRFKHNYSLYEDRQLRTFRSLVQARHNLELINKL